MVTYYHHFLPNIATILSLLYSVLKDKPKTLAWNNDQEKAFISVKKALDFEIKVPKGP